MNFPTVIAVAACKFVNEHKEDIIDGVKNAISTIVETVTETVDKIT